jgi:transposase-like protein
MDEDQSKAGEGLTDRTPEQVQAEIVQTRAELGDTVAALAEKTDVKGQAKQAVDEAKATVSGKVTEIRDTATEKKDAFVSSAQQAAPDSAAQAGSQAQAFAKDNREALIAGGLFVLGVLIGRRSAR